MLEILAGLTVALLVVPPVAIAMVGLVLIVAGWTSASTAQVALTCPTTHQREVLVVLGPGAARPVWKVQSCTAFGKTCKGACASCSVLEDAHWSYTSPLAAHWIAANDRAAHAA